MTALNKQLEYIAGELKFVSERVSQVTDRHEWYDVGICAAYINEMDEYIPCIIEYITKIRDEVNREKVYLELRRRLGILSPISNYGHDLKWNEEEGLLGGDDKENPI